VANGKALRASYVAPVGGALPDDALACIAFGAHATPAEDPRAFRVALEPLGGAAPVVELWQGAAPATLGRDGEVAWAHDGQHLFGRLELDEAAHGGIEGAANAGYRRLLAFARDSGFPHLVRIWNYFDAINAGGGDAERYRRFCVGRAAALVTECPPERLPAATAIGRDGEGTALQLYWIATRTPGDAIENPRQQSAYRYPRSYGPASPSFSRAMALDRRLLLISGTASVVGHATHHEDDALAQLAETLANFASLCEAASKAHPAIPPWLVRESLLKVYVRDPAQQPAVAAALEARLPPGCTPLYLRGDICRGDLLLEIDAVHPGRDG
jgi:chorismate lyase/3-hydroxybenzoate synthase